MVSELKKTCNWDLKFKYKIGFEIHVEIKLGQILGSTYTLISCWIKIRYNI